ncbi:protein, SNF2 family [Dictyocaulus viviparus]|uniref:Protein, SNF2 family n=1 Tax=Dictyocaulus viviparus TaxID=29172 RepID=A0A0D8Y4P6_DICVI|nr:protein, SNF2 family [Dictyocaulus viviparus]
MTKLRRDGKGPFLVLCPLSVCDHWVSEIKRFSCGDLSPVAYFGYSERRADILKEEKIKENTVLIIPYHLFRNEHETLTSLQLKSQLKFNVVVVDEAHAIKNQGCQLAKCLKIYKTQAWFLLMTGTPIQNNLDELYSLLTFIDSSEFGDTTHEREQFVSRYKDNVNINCLKEILSKYMIRRTKDIVCRELPSCDHVCFDFIAYI